MVGTLEIMMDLIHLWRHAFGKLPRPHIVHKDRLTEDQINDAFSVANDNPLFRAVLQTLEDHLSDAVDLTSNIKTATVPGHVSHCAGGIDTLTRFMEDIINKQQVNGEKL